MYSIAPSVCAVLVAILVIGCDSTPEALVADLRLGGERAEAARQTLLLAKETALPALLEGLADETGAGRRAIADVLLSLMLRIDDDELVSRLQHHLLHDPDADVRVLLARRMGTQTDESTIDALMAALDDPDGEVRYGAWLSLDALEGHWTTQQRANLRDHASRGTDDEHAGARTEALIRVDRFTAEWLRPAQQAALSAQMAEAESLYLEAMRYAPRAHQPASRLATFYHENDRLEESFALRRRYGMLLDVPELSDEPVIDGRLDDVVWQQAAHDARFYVYSHRHDAALPSATRTEIFVGTTDEALLVGLLAWDDDIDGLVLSDGQRDVRVDRFEVFIDPPPIRQLPTLQATLNALGVVGHVIFDVDGDTRVDRSTAVSEGDWDGVGAVHVGEDRWTAEYRLPFGQELVPHPESGQDWGFNIVRTYRGQQFNQWTRTYESGFSVAHLGVLLFQ